MEPGRMLAEGRDAQIFEYGPGLVLRRAKNGRSLAYEANTMELVRAFGVPAPRVHDVIEDGTAIVMERAVGPSLLDWALRRPWRFRSIATVLAELGQVVHRVIAPSWLRETGDDGLSVLHLDLHPLNVIMTAAGPVLIDWSNAARGHAATDDALTWILLETAEAPKLPPPMPQLIARLRRSTASAFLAATDTDATRAALPVAAARRAADRNTTDGERRAIEAMLARQRS